MFSKRLKKTLFLLGCCLLSCSLIAEDINFYASVDTSSVALGEYLQVTFTLSGSTGGKNFQPPPFTDFDVLSGPNQSTSMQITNGSVSSSVSFSYVLQPRSEGKHVVGAASIEVDGRRLETKPITIDVTKGSAPRAQQSPAAGQQDVTKQIGNNLMLKLLLDQSRVYQGEQITAIYKVYTRVQILDFNVTKLPSFTGFWSEDLQKSNQATLQTEVLDGKEYRTAILKKVALFPQRAGTLEIDPMQIECVVPVSAGRGDWFDQFFDQGTNVKYRTQSPAVQVTVLPLPSNQVPQDFHGAVGKFTMEASLDKHQSTTDNPVTLKVKISGTGNLKLVQPPDISIPPDVERFDPKVSNSVQEKGNLISGSKTYEYLLIPRHAGEQKIPSFSFSYFDVDRKSYVSLRSPDFLLKVTPGSVAQAPVSSEVNQQDVKLLAQDIRFLKTGNISLKKGNTNFAGSSVYFLMYLSGPFAFLLFIVFVRRRETLAGDALLIRRRKARKMATKRLGKAKSLLRSGKKEEFYAEVSRALWGYLADKLSLNASELSMETVRNQLNARGIDPATVQSIASVMETCEFARFAPSSDSMQMDQIWKNAVNLVSSVEEQVR